MWVILIWFGTKKEDFFSRNSIIIVTICSMLFMMIDLAFIMKYATVNTLKDFVMSVNVHQSLRLGITS